MAETNHHPPGLFGLARRLVSTGLGAFENRAELFLVEWREERLRLVELLLWAVILLFLAALGVLLVTATVIFLFREDLRLYAAGVFAVLYLGAAAVVWFNFRSMLKHEPFSETLDQVKKDREWLGSFK
jgi:uncharacterized membrane protein YqjE